MNIVLFGPPGSGKGVQSQFLYERLGYSILSTGEIFRNITKDASDLYKDLYKKVTQILSSGALVPDYLVMEIVQHWLNNHKHDNVVFDGIPRTILQKQQLDKLLKNLGSPSVFVFNLEVPYKQLVERILNRNVLESRTDDTEAIFQERFNIYVKETQPLLESFQHVYNIDGNLEKEKVFKSILNILTER